MAGNLCLPGTHAEFEQNPLALNTLITKTGHKRIVECASDQLWGTGLSLGGPQCLDHTKWISQGILGQILEDIHSEFQQHERYRHKYSMPSGIAYDPTPPYTSINDVTGTTTALTAPSALLHYLCLKRLVRLNHQIHCTLNL